MGRPVTIDTNFLSDLGEISKETLDRIVRCDSDDGIIFLGITSGKEFGILVVACNTHPPQAIWLPFKMGLLAIAPHPHY